MAVTATSYTISYSNTVTDCFTDSGASTDIDGDETMYTLTGLEEGTEYTVTVTTLLTSGETVVDMQTSTTIATGQFISVLTSLCLQFCMNISHIQLHLLLPRL